MLHNSGPTFTFLFTATRCNLYGWCNPRHNWMQSRLILYVANLHQHSFTHSRILYCRPQNNCDAAPEMKIEDCEVGWPWRDRTRDAVTSVDKDTLRRVLDETAFYKVLNYFNLWSRFQDMTCTWNTPSTNVLRGMLLISWTSFHLWIESTMGVWVGHLWILFSSRMSSSLPEWTKGKASLCWIRKLFVTTKKFTLEKTRPKSCNVSSNVCRLRLYCVPLEELHSAASTESAAPRQLTCSPRFILSLPDFPARFLVALCVSWSWQMWEETRSILTSLKTPFVSVYFLSQPTPQPYFPDPDPRNRSLLPA
jgi:hypothetical protein